MENKPKLMPKALTVATFNTHKGMSPLNKYVNLPEMACALNKLAPDLLMLQEVQGENNLRAKLHSNWLLNHIMLIWLAKLTIVRFMA